VDAVPRFSPGKSELLLMLKKPILDEKQMLRAKDLAPRFSIDLDILDADPKKNRYSYYKYYIVRIKAVIDNEILPSMEQASLFG
jgi:hypothetical protein